MRRRGHRQPAGLPLDSADAPLYQTGLYLQDEMAWQRWHLDLSGRYDRIVSENGNSRRQDDHVGRAAAAPLITACRRTSAGAGDYPGFADRSRRNQLKPTTSEQYEAGVKYQPNGTRDLYSVALYDLTQNDVANRNVQDGTYTPSGKVHAQGIELEARSQLTERFSTVAGYTLNHLRFKDSVDGNDGHTPYVTPNSMASLWGIISLITA